MSLTETLMEEEEREDWALLLRAVQTTRGVRELDAVVGRWVEQRRREGRLSGEGEDGAQCS